MANTVVFDQNAASDLDPHCSQVLSEGKYNNIKTAVFLLFFVCVCVCFFVFFLFFFRILKQQ